MKLNWNSPVVRGFKLKNLPWEGDGYFLEQHQTALGIFRAVFN